MPAQQKTMPTVISALTARTQLGQVLRRVKSSKERFLIGRNGEPQAIVMGIDDYFDVVAPVPDWLKNSWKNSMRNGTDKLTMRQIDAVIADDRREISKKPSTLAPNPKRGK
jgi:prevent-host-death family protein